MPETGGAPAKKRQLERVRKGATNWARRVLIAMVALFLISSVYGFFDPKKVPAPVHVGVGCIYWGFGKLPKAAEAFEHAVYVDPENATEYILLSSTYTDLTRLAEAEQVARRALVLAPDNPFAHLTMGRVALKGHKWREAIDHFDRAIKSGLESVSLGGSYRFIKWLIQPMQQSIFADCEQSCREAVAVNPENADAQAALGWIFVAKGDEAGALRQYQILRKADPDRAKLLLNALGHDMGPQKAQRLLDMIQSGARARSMDAEETADLFRMISGDMDKEKASKLLEALE